MSVIAKIAKNTVAKNTSVLVLGQVASRALSIVYVAALARYVGTQGMGQVSTATALNGLMALILAPGLSQLLVRDAAGDKRKITSYVGNMLLTRALLGLPFILITMLVARLVGYMDETIVVIQTYTFVFLLDSLAEVMASVFEATERMEFKAGGAVARDIVNFTLSLAAIALKFSLTTIVFASVAAQAVKLLIYAVLYRRNVPGKLHANFSKSKLMLAASLPFWALIVLHSVQAQLGTIVLSLYHPEDVVGVYSSANNLLVMMLLIPASFSSAIYPAFSRLYARSRQDLQRFYQICFKYLLVVGFPLGLGSILVGDRIIVLVYGEEFASAAGVLRILAVFMFTFVGYANGPLLQTIGKQTFFAWTQALALAGNVILCFVLVPRWGPVGAAAAYVVSGIATFFVHSVASHRFFHAPLPWLTMGKVSLANALMGICTWGALQLGVAWPVVVVLIAPIGYGIGLLLLGIINREELRVLAAARGGDHDAGTSPAVHLSSSTRS